MPLHHVVTPVSQASTAPGFRYFSVPPPLPMHPYAHPFIYHLVPLPFHPGIVQNQQEFVPQQPQQVWSVYPPFQSVPRKKETAGVCICNGCCIHGTRCTQRRRFRGCRAGRKVQARPPPPPSIPQKAGALATSRSLANGSHTLSTVHTCYIYPSEASALTPTALTTKISATPMSLPHPSQTPSDPNASAPDDFRRIPGTLERPLKSSVASEDPHMTILTPISSISSIPTDQLHVPTFSSANMSSASPTVQEIPTVSTTRPVAPARSSVAQNMPSETVSSIRSRNSPGLMPLPPPLLRKEPTMHVESLGMSLVIPCPRPPHTSFPAPIPHTTTFFEPVLPPPAPGQPSSNSCPLGPPLLDPQLKNHLHLMKHDLQCLETKVTQLVSDMCLFYYYCFDDDGYV